MNKKMNLKELPSVEMNHFVMNTAEKLEMNEAIVEKDFWVQFVCTTYLKKVSIKSILFLKVVLVHPKPIISPRSYTIFGTNFHKK